jgi:CAAX prenyl protease-like protein
MNILRQHLSASPIHARVLPFFLFLLPLFVQDKFGEEWRYWIYLTRTLLGAWCLWEMRTLVPEMRWNFSWEGVVVGVLVLVIWVGLDPYYPKNHLLMAASDPWNPFKAFGAGSVLGWFFFWVRTIGSAVVVPPLEEVFYRSFIYRYLVKLKFEEMPLHRMHWLSFFVTSILFGLEHYQWLAGILCGLAYQFLVIRKGRLGDAIFAHAITNFLLGIWILWKGGDAWMFW